MRQVNLESDFLKTTVPQAWMFVISEEEGLNCH